MAWLYCACVQCLASVLQIEKITSTDFVSNLLESGSFDNSTHIFDHFKAKVHTKYAIKRRFICILQVVSYNNSKSKIVVERSVEF